MIDLEHDSLNRNPFLDELFNLFDNFGHYNEGGLTISINGKYGSGKTTLLNFIEEKNKKDNKYDIIKYDAWKNNLFDNPLIPILYTLNNISSLGHKIKECAKNIVKSLPKIFINSISKTMKKLDISSININENIFDDYTKHIAAITSYKTLLENHCREKKVILLIDELDRCLPVYQIKVLETLYNIFNIPNLIIVLAIDKSQLEHTIKEIYGGQENISGYLSKFIQYEIDLPNDETNKYLQTLISFNCKYSEIKTICAKMFELADISLRECLQIVNELNLICNENDKDGKPKLYVYWYPIFICLVLIIKKLYREIYNKYFYKPLPDKIIDKQISLNETDYSKFLADIKGLRIEPIINYFTSKDMNFAFILYFINYFCPIENITVESLASYTKYNMERIENIANSWETPMWNKYEYNQVLHKIRIFK